MYHKPVLLNECIDGLNISPEGTYVDVTFGGGGHSREILKKIPGGRLLAFDQDPDASDNLPDDTRITFIKGNFRYLKSFLKLHGIISIDGLLADLGVSSHQFDIPQKGFSTRFEGHLDMRMNPDSTLTAEHIVNTYEQKDLERVLFLYGELANAGKVSELICSSREAEKIDTTTKLVNVISPAAPRGRENKFYAQVFQAMRIEVNEELEALKEMLSQAAEIIKPDGRLVVIAYHSLEDRLVKNFIKADNFEGKLEKDFYGNPLVRFKAVNRKPITPGEDEVKENSRARSARLRIAEKI
jgi:16S rRNA (cytosine1402-N4)-methyltransferase